ncbi:hypothetical protein ABPG75_001601 [Micractinium tetrahymenae]
METPSLSFGADGAANALQAVAAGVPHPHAALPVLDDDPFAAALQAATAPVGATAAMAAAGGGAAGSESAPGALHLSGSGVPRPRFSAATLKGRTGPLFCQVEGCGTPLEGLKEYHQRYKVCEEHLKTPCIVRDGQQVRFCQQCGRFQPLEDFDDNKRSCRVRLQRHNARRRKRPREAGAGVAGGAAGDLSEYDQAAAEMAQLAAQQYAAATGAPPPGAIPITAKEIQAMQDALQFASSTLAHSNQVVTGKPAGEEGGEEGEDGEAGATGAGSMPFVPAPDVMMLLLKGYAAMFHYVLDSATIRALAPPSELPPDAGAAAGAGGALDPLHMQQLLQAQGMFGAAAGGLPLLVGDGDVAGILAAAGGQELAAADVEDALAEAAAAAGLAGGAAAPAVGSPGAPAAGQRPQQLDGVQAAVAGVLEPALPHQQGAAAGARAGLTAEQVAAALIQPVSADAAAAAAAAAGAAAGSEALAAAAAGSAGYFGTLGAAAADQGPLIGIASAAGVGGEAAPH